MSDISPITDEEREAIFNPHKTVPRRFVEAGIMSWSMIAVLLNARLAAAEAKVERLKGALQKSKASILDEHYGMTNRIGESAVEAIDAALKEE